MAVKVISRPEDDGLIALEAGFGFLRIGGRRIDDRVRQFVESEDSGHQHDRFGHEVVLETASKTATHARRAHLDREPVEPGDAARQLRDFRRVPASTSRPLRDFSRRARRRSAARA